VSERSRLIERTGGEPRLFEELLELFHERRIVLRQASSARRRCVHGISKSHMVRCREACKLLLVRGLSRRGGEPDERYDGVCHGGNPSLRRLS
jgi:hypothetical protein